MQLFKEPFILKNIIKPHYTLFIFATMNLSSKLLEDAVNAFASLPGIGNPSLSASPNLHVFHTHARARARACGFEYLVGKDQSDAVSI